MSEQYKTPGTFKGGTIQLVGITTEKAPYSELEAQAEAKRAMMAE